MEIICSICKKHFQVPITPQQLTAWRDGQLIQMAAPNLTDTERELIISETCNECFAAMFSKSEEPS